ncbi:hypothetical protein HII31_08656 [Pseudocercospora fuligena]|uniref:Myb-like domain-containing protein n=1 Tax=Pseudocercospora fuligena TaxID=685502 RepID=A0A8H6VKR9_9PEZI|nr:hypothetical protein HII31_08656 [Pseudocercospora fuligena]
MPVRFTKEEDELLLKHREEGMIFVAIAKLLQRSKSSVVSRFFRLMDTKSPSKRLFSEAEDQLLYERRMSGHSYKDIANELGRSYYTVANRCYFIVGPRSVRHHKRGIPEQASALFSAVDDSLIIRRKAEGATGVEIARELRMESQNAHLAVANRWRKLQLRREIPLSGKPHVPITAELARRVVELRAAGKKFREIAVLERCSLSRVQQILSKRKRALDGKRTTFDDVAPNAKSEQTHHFPIMKDRQQMASQQDTQEVQLSQSSAHGLHRRQKAADQPRHMRRWTPEQDEKLWGFAMQNGRDWKALQLQMPDRTVKAIQARYTRIMCDKAILAEQKL